MSYDFSCARILRDVSNCILSNIKYSQFRFHINKKLLFTAWGVGGVIGPVLAGYILDKTGGYHVAFMVAAVLCFFAAVLGWILKPPGPRQQAA